MSTPHTKEASLPLAQRITQGPVAVCSGDAGNLYNIECRGSGNGDVPLATLKGPDRKSNAELIAEAFNVTHETGRTPRQLADERAALIAALEEIRDRRPQAYAHDSAEMRADDFTTAQQTLDRLNQ